MPPMGKESNQSKKTKILFVCHENICRSPMAEFVMKIGGSPVFFGLSSLCGGGRTFEVA